MSRSPSFTIKAWSPDDRPREKLLIKGLSALSDAELLAILLGSGTQSLSAVDVAKNLLKHAGNSLLTLGTLSIKELMKVKGIGEAKAIALVAAVELGRRRKTVEPEEKPKITCSADAFRELNVYFTDRLHEEFWVLFLNRANRVIKKQMVSIGGVTGTVVDPKIIFKTALEELATGIIVAHNHPSGQLVPSSQDKILTQKLKDGGKLLEIQLLDHLIVGGKEFFSFADEGLL